MRNVVPSYPSIGNSPLFAFAATAAVPAAPFFDFPVITLFELAASLIFMLSEEDPYYIPPYRSGVYPLFRIFFDDPIINCGLSDSSKRTSFIASYRISANPFPYIIVLLLFVML